MSTPATEIEHFIGGSAAPAAGGRTFESRDPHDGSLLATVARGSAVDG
jgi:aminomuconate-semialdehyde/2-hydroxymuconate-6-semialdehyde dehydrogenase